MDGSTNFYKFQKISSKWEKVIFKEFAVSLRRILHGLRNILRIVSVTVLLAISLSIIMYYPACEGNVTASHTLNNNLLGIFPNHISIFPKEYKVYSNSAVVSTIFGVQSVKIQVFHLHANTKN